MNAEDEHKQFVTNYQSYKVALIYLFDLLIQLHPIFLLQQLFNANNNI